MGYTGNEIVVNPGQAINRLGHTVNLFQVLVGKDIAVGKLNAHHQHIGTTKAVFDTVV